MALVSLLTLKPKEGRSVWVLGRCGVGSGRWDKVRSQGLVCQVSFEAGGGYRGGDDGRFFPEKYSVSASQREGPSWDWSRIGIGQDLKALLSSIPLKAPSHCRKAEGGSRTQRKVTWAERPQSDHSHPRGAEESGTPSS